MEQRLNCAVIGCGSLARAQHIPNIAASERLVLHTCCDVSEAALQDCRERFGARRVTRDFREAVADPDIGLVVIATTERLRLPLIRAAAEAGKPVYCEKPIAPTLDEMYAVQRVVHAAGIRFCVGHNRRNSPAMIDAHRIFRAHMAQPPSCPWRWERDHANRPALPEDGVAGMSVRINDDWYSWKTFVHDRGECRFGPMLFEMTHFTDLCNWFMAAEPAEVAAIEHHMLNHGVIVHYRTGEMATLTLCANGTFGYPKELYEMFGNGGAVVVDHMVEVRTAGVDGVPARTVYPMLNDRHPDVGTEGGLAGWLAKRRAACAEAAAKGDTSLIFTADADKGHAHALERFVDEIRGQGPQVCGIDDAVRATRVAFGAIKAAHEGRTVKMEEV